MSSVPNVHSVHFYENDGALIDRLCGVVSSGLLIGNSVLIVASEHHRNLLVNALLRLEVDLREYARRGQFTMYDSTHTLELFMVEGMPDRDRFNASMGRFLAQAKDKARSEGQRLTVFGEMVAELWAAGNKAAALELESIWNQTLNDGAFHLHCAYPRDVVRDDSSGIQNICQSHTHIFGTFAAPQVA